MSAATIEAKKNELATHIDAHFPGARAAFNKLEDDALPDAPHALSDDD